MKEYQKFVAKTDVTSPVAGLPYLCLGLSGEAGEVAEVCKKSLRPKNKGFKKFSDETMRERILDELGDVLWYATATSLFLGSSLEEVMDINMKKLSARPSHG